MKHTLTNEEVLEIEQVEVRHDGKLAKGSTYHLYEVTLWTFNDHVVYRGRIRWRETDRQRQRGYRVTPTVPERVIAHLRTQPQVYYANGRHGNPATERLIALQDLFGHLRRERLKR